MALYFPQYRLALDIVDDPAHAPVDTDAFPDLTVVRITRDEVSSPRAIRRLGRELARRAQLSAPALRRLRRDLARLLEGTARR